MKPTMRWPNDLKARYYKITAVTWHGFRWGDFTPADSRVAVLNIDSSQHCHELLGLIQNQTMTRILRYGLATVTEVIECSRKLKFILH